MSAPVEVRRFLHVNYNCTDLDGLERFYVEVFGLKTVMRSGSTSDGTPFGIYGSTTCDAAFVYDHRGGRRSNALELVKWVEPPTTGSVYPDPWDRGIQAVAYTAADLDAVATRAVEFGGSVARRSDTWLLLRDPEGVWVEVQRADGPSEARYLRIVCSDLDRSIAWWEGIGFARGVLPIPPANEIWPAHGEHAVAAEQAMLPTDDPTFGIVLTTWTGPTPIGPTYAMPFHQGLYRAAMAIDDVRGSFDTLVQTGYARQNHYTFQLPGTKLTDGLTMVFIRDPDDILIELVDRPRKL
jgi:catechol 2,3-dioxygenase-like lactoylglutathione lyase family enzyme